MILLDPELLVPPSGDWHSEAYWIALSDWSADRRIHVGPATVTFGYGLLAQIDWPALQSLAHVEPAEIARDLMRSLNQLLSRVAKDHRAEAAPRALSPPPAGNPEATEALRADLGKVADHVRAIATVDRSWATRPARATCKPVPPEAVELIFSPGAQLAAEREDTIRQSLNGRRVLVVGGQLHRRSVEQLEACGAAVTWAHCERRKRPKMDELWGSLRPGEDSPVIVTGKIGHSVSDAAKVQCDKAGIRPILVEQPQEVYARVVERLGTR